MSSILVLGPGAIGGTLAALLAEQGHTVELRGRSAPLASVRLEGGGYGQPRDVALGMVRGQPDLVLTATKTQDLEAALQQHRAHIGDAPVVALQNGLAQDEIVARLTPRWAGAVTALDAQMLKPGVVDCARAGTLLLGGPEAARVEPILSGAVATERADDLRGARWTKLLVNLGNVVPALTGLSFQEAARHKGLATAHVRMLREGVRVARAEGVTLRPIPWTDPKLMRAVALVPDVMARAFYRMRVKRVLGDVPGYGSTWQSLQRGGSLETEWLNGEIVWRGARRGMPTPVNEAACSLVAKRDRLSPAEAARALGVA